MAHQYSGGQLLIASAPPNRTVVFYAPNFWTTLVDYFGRESVGGMSKSRHTEAQILAVLRELDAGRIAADVAREQGVSKHTVYSWRAKYGGIDVSGAQRVKELEDENARLRKLVADLSLEKDLLQAVLRKNGWHLQ